MKRKMTALVLAFAMLATLCLTACSKQGEETLNEEKLSPEVSSQYSKENPLVLTIGFENGPTDSSVNCGYLWAEMLREKSDGRIKLEVYPSGEMGNASEMFQMVQEGSLDMVSLIPVTLGNFDPRLELAAIPGLFGSLEEGESFDRDGFIGDYIESVYNEIGVTRMVHGEPNFYYFMTTNKAGAITSIDTMKNMKLRIPSSPITKTFFEVAGAVPTTVSWGEIYTSLQRNVIDGITNNLVWSVTAKFPEVAQTISLLPVNYHTSDWLLNLDKWNSIPADLQEIIKSCADEIEGTMRTNWNTTVGKNMTDMEASGVNFVEVSDEQVAEFRSQCFDLMSDYIVSVWGQDMLDRLEAEVINAG